jgi:hypothetical protein
MLLTPLGDFNVGTRRTAWVSSEKRFHHRSSNYILSAAKSVFCSVRDRFALLRDAPLARACARRNIHREAGGAKWCIGILNPSLGSEEAAMFGYGLIGTLVVIVLIVWIVRSVRAGSHLTSNLCGPDSMLPFEWVTLFRCAVFYAGMGCKLFVALENKLSLHLIQRFSNKHIPSS